ncbi:MAG: septal ring lytic transglycosylase RlpA family protein [Burkholderiaceae bacterium]|nr:septal ring lytic transglycosylase RlpA family protein [Burkholderiaceae bacterium]
MLLAFAIAGCSVAPRQLPPTVTPAKTTAATSATALPPAGSGRGGYYKDDGPGENIPLNLEKTPDAQPKVESPLPRANRPYAVLGNIYTPITDSRPFVQRGIGSWYGKKFHGKKTSSGELYDMYKMTAAHPTLPIPSYSRVTNLANGKQVIVRINDRGPFHSDRIIDLSYTAALKLGYLGRGSGMLQVEHLRPEDIEQITQSEEAAQNAIAQNPPLQAKVSQYPQLPLDSQADDVRNTTQPAASLTGYYLQLGAFSHEHNAEAMRAQYTLSWANRYPPAQVVRKGELYRLYAGPFPSHSHAADAAQQMQSSGAPKPLIVER